METWIAVVFTETALILAIYRPALLPHLGSVIKLVLHYKKVFAMLWKQGPDYLLFQLSGNTLD